MENKDEVLRYHGVLQRMDHKEKIAMIKSLVVSGGKQNVGLLMDLLGDPHYDFRRAAYLELCKLGNTILKEVLEVFETGNHDQKYWCIQLMCEMGPSAVGGLELALKDSDPNIQRVAIDKLGELTQASSVRPLLQIFKDGPWSVRQACFQALQRYGDEIGDVVRESLKSDSEDLVFWSVKLLGKMGFQARKPLYQVLKKADPEMKFVIASALGESGDIKALELLVKCFAEDSWIHCKRASDSLVQVGSVAIGVIREDLKKQSASDIYWHIYTLLRLGEEGMENLIEFLETAKEAYLWNCREVLMKTGDLIVPCLKRLCSSKDRKARFFGYQLLTDLRMTSTANILINGLKDPIWTCRKLCADALSQMGEEITDLLKPRLGSADDDEMYWLIQVLQKTVTGRELLVNCLRRESKSVVSQAARALQGKVVPAAILPLLNCLRSEEWVVRKEAAEALLSAQNMAMEEVVQSLAIEDEEYRFWISYILKRYPTRSFPYLTTLLYRQDYPVHLAAMAMGIIANSYFKVPLQEALKEGDDLLVLYCAWALSSVDPQRELKAVWGLLSRLDVRQYPLLEELVQKYRISAPDHLNDGLRSVQDLTIRNCIYLAGKLQLEGCSEALRERLKDENVEYAIEAAEALFRIQPPGILQIFHTMLDRKIPDSLRLKLLTVLAALEDNDELVYHILKMMTEAQEEQEASTYAREILKLGMDAVPALIAALGREEIPTRKTAAEMLLEFGSLAVEPLKNEVDDPNADPNRKFWAGKILKTMQQHGS